MAKAIREECQKVAGKEMLAMEAFARALDMIPTIISDNAGYDSAYLLAALKAAHASNNNTQGLDMDSGSVGCMDRLGITESYQVSTSTEND